jgi:hypothetical protein
VKWIIITGHALFWPLLVIAALWIDGTQERYRGEAAVELARRGSSPAVVGCILKPNPPAFNGRCNAILEGK